MCMHAYTCTHIHSYKHTHIPIHIHTHMIMIICKYLCLESSGVMLSRADMMSIASETLPAAFLPWCHSSVGNDLRLQDGYCNSRHHVCIQGMKKWKGACRTPPAVLAPYLGKVQAPRLVCVYFMGHSSGHKCNPLLGCQDTQVQL